MRARNSISRLGVFAPVVDVAVDDVDEDRILDRILSSPRPATRRRPLVLALAGVVLLAVAAVVAAVEIGHTPAPRATGGHRVPLSGATFKFAGYHFKTPAGFKASDTSCPPPASDGQPAAVLSSFAAAASAEGGCVEAFLLAPGSPTAPPATPADAEPVAVGSYQGYYVASDTTLYVALTAVNGGPATYLVLYAQGLTEDQLIAVAVSGLPSGSAASSNRVVHN